MSSINLYYAPLEKRNKVYFLDSKYQQSNYVRDYNLNQFIIDEINSQQNLYSDFQKSKEVLNTLEESQKRVTGTEQTKKALKKELKLLMLEPEKNKEEILRITQNPIFALPPSTTKAQKAQKIKFTPELTAQLESVPRNTPSPASTPASTPKSPYTPTSPGNKPSRDSEGKLTPIGQMAEIAKDAQKRTLLKGSSDYERLRNLPRTGKGRFPQIEELRKFAKSLNPPLVLTSTKKSSVLDEIINELYERIDSSINENDEWDGNPTFEMYGDKRKAQQSKGEGEGLLSILKKNKTNNIPLTSKVVFYVHKKNVKTTRKKKLPLPVSVPKSKK